MTIATRQTSLFQLGQLFMSRGVIEAGIPVLPLVVRHSSGVRLWRRGPRA